MHSVSDDAEPPYYHVEPAILFLHQHQLSTCEERNGHSIQT